MKKVIEKSKPENVKFSRTSIILFLSALLTILAGYIIMAQGDIAVSPILLVIGYVILIPASIMKK